MDLRRAVFLGTLLWVAIFFEVSVLMFGLGLKGDAYYYAHYVLLGILSAVAGLWYFSSVNGGTLEGIKAGLVMLAVGTILDAVITVPLFVKSYSFFADPAMLLGYAESVAGVAVVGWAKAKLGKA